MFRNDLTKEQAEQLGYASITTGYSTAQKWMLDNVLADMARGDIDHSAIPCEDGIQVFRRGKILSRDTQ